jgi:hypothetical protein
MIDVTPESGVPATLDELLGGPAPAGNGRPPRVLIAPSYGNRASQARFADTLAREVPFAEPPVRDRLTGMSEGRCWRCTRPGGLGSGERCPATTPASTSSRRVTWCCSPARDAFRLWAGSGAVGQLA